jgi:hypothetical protein
MHQNIRPQDKPGTVECTTPGRRISAKLAAYFWIARSPLLPPAYSADNASSCPRIAETAAKLSSRRSAPSPTRVPGSRREPARRIPSVIRCRYGRHAHRSGIFLFVRGRRPWLILRKEMAAAELNGQIAKVDIVRSLPTVVSEGHRRKSVALHSTGQCA